MKVTVDTRDPRWIATNDSMWSLWSDVVEYGLVTRRVLFTITYLGRTHVAFGGGPMRWKVTDHRYFPDSRLPQTEFHDPDEAKAWVNAIIRLEGT